MTAAMADPVDAAAAVEARVRMVQAMDHSGVVLSSRIAEAFLNTDRHPFVPVFYRRCPGDLFVPWRAGDAVAGWLETVYSRESLITEVDGIHAEDAPDTGVRGVPTSSSTAPDLMADMLDALDVRPGARILEIGTGSGYNAALLARLAEGRVTTVEHSAGLAASARERLAAQGVTADVVHTDGARGWPAAAPYDRLIATCSVSRIPVAWLDQCAPGGLLVVPLKGTLAGGSIAWLEKLPDGTAAGRLLHTPAAFMPLLPDVGASGVPPCPVDAGPEDRPSELSARVLDDWTFSFFAQLHLPPGAVRAFHQDAGLHTTTLRDPADGARTTVRDHEDGGVTVAVHGRDLWEPIERAHATWIGLHRPRREWLTLRVTTNVQTAHLATPDGRILTWTL